MGGCCEPDGYDDMFGSKFSRHVARRYRRRGLDKTAARMVSWLADQGVEGSSVLEIGGGVGGIQLELLRRGASRATNLELVDAYDEDAAALAADAGLGDRVTRRRLDIVESPDEVEPHDIVVLHRVVCCYPDYDRLLTTAADHATRLLVFSHPPRNLPNRVVVRIENLLFRLRRMSFRTYLHPPEELASVPRRRGLRDGHQHRGLVWQTVGFAR